MRSLFYGRKMYFKERFFRPLIIIILIIQFSNIHASKSDIKKAADFLNEGDYDSMIQVLERNSNKDIIILRAKHYFLGIAYARNQDFEQAIRNFSLAIKYKNQKPDLYYELGQALYAMNELDKAQKSFSTSANNGFKESQSHYYIAHIAQLLEKSKMAKEFFIKVINNPKTTIDLKQVARFQLSETLLTMARKTQDVKKFVELHVLPQFEKALQVKNTGPTAVDILKRIKSIQDEFGLNPTKFVSGKALPKKSLSIFASQNIGYNNNFTLTDDLPGNVQSKEDTFISETNIEASYLFIMKRKYTIEPGLAISHTVHSERDNSAVFSADEYEIRPSLDFTLAHKQFNNPATLYLNLNYDYRALDNRQQKNRVFNNRTYTYELGNRFKYFNFGTSNIKVRQRVFRSFNPALSVDTTTIGADQLVVKGGKVYLFLLNLDLARFTQADTNDNDTLLLRTDYIWPSILPNLSLNLALSYTFISYKNSATDASQGVEKILSPSFKITRDITDRFAVDVEYIYTKNTSDAQSRNYTSHLTSLEFSYSY